MRYSEFLIETYDEDQAIIKIADTAAKFLSNEFVTSESKKTYKLKDIPNINQEEFDEIIKRLIDSSVVNMVKKIKKSPEIYGIVRYKKKFHISVQIPKFDESDFKFDSEKRKLYCPKLEISFRRALVHELAHVLDALKSSYHLKLSNKPYLEDPTEIAARVREGMSLISFAIDEMVEKSKLNNDENLSDKLKEKLRKLIPNIIRVHVLDNPHEADSRQHRVYKKKYQHIKSRLYSHAVKYLEQKLKDEPNLETL